MNEARAGDERSEILLSSLTSWVLPPLPSFRSFGLELHLTDCAAEEIAAACFEDKTGARGLGGMLERTLRDFKFELGGRYGDKAIEVVIDGEVVRDPKAGLDRVLKELH